MSDPRPLLEESKDALESALLREARDYGASEETRRRTYGALGLALPVPRSFLQTAAGKMVLATIAIGACVGLYFSLSHGSAPQPAPSTPPAPAIVTNTEPAANVAQAPLVDTAAAPVAPPPRVLPGAAQTRAIAPKPSASSSLTEEIAAIDQARQALYANDKNAAIRALDDYDRRFPSGVFSPEAQKLRARAQSLP